MNIVLIILAALVTLGVFGVFIYSLARVAAKPTPPISKRWSVDVKGPDGKWVELMPVTSIDDSAGTGGRADDEWLAENPGIVWFYPDDELPDELYRFGGSSGEDDNSNPKERA